MSSSELPYQLAARTGGPSVFLSLRFGGAGDAQREAAGLRALLTRRNIIVTPALDGSLAEAAGVSRLDEIMNSVRQCDLFVIFATPEYGENTGNPMCSYEECVYARKKRKPFAVINMCGGDLDIMEPAIESVLMEKIWKPWSIGEAGIADWIASQLPGGATSGGGSSAAPPAAPARLPASSSISATVSGKTSTVKCAVVSGAAKYSDRLFEVDASSPAHGTNKYKTAEELGLLNEEALAERERVAVEAAAPRERHAEEDAKQLALAVALAAAAARDLESTHAVAMAASREREAALAEQHQRDHRWRRKAAATAEVTATRHTHARSKSAFTHLAGQAVAIAADTERNRRIRPVSVRRNATSALREMVTKNPIKPKEGGG